MLTLRKSTQIEILKECSSERSAGRQTVIVLGAFALLIFSVLSFGAVQEWATCVVNCGAAVLFLSWAELQLRNGQIELTNPALVPALLLGCIPVFQLLSGRTAYPYATRFQLFTWVSCAVFFLIGSELAYGNRIRKTLALSITAFGTLYAIFAIIQSFLAPPNVLYGFITTHGTGFGSYTNRNHYAGLIEMLLPFGVMSATSRIRSSGIRLLAGFGSLVMLASVFLSQSRGGMVSVTVAVLALTILYWKQHRSAAALAGIVVSIAITAIFVGYLAYAPISNRSIHEATDQMRVQIARDSIRLVTKHPLLGSGLGTFPYVYPEVRSFPTDLYVNAAHNDFVQLTVEVGVVGTILSALFFWLVFRNAWRIWYKTREGWAYSTCMAACVACGALLVHSFFDFNLQIPANAAVFAFCAGVASSTRATAADPAKFMDEQC